MTEVDDWDFDLQRSAHSEGRNCAFLRTLPVTIRAELSEVREGVPPDKKWRKVKPSYTLRLDLEELILSGNARVYRIIRCSNGCCDNYLCVCVSYSEPHTVPGGDDLVCDVTVGPNTIPHHAHRSHNFQTLR